jgi:hypothetical protein
MDFCIILVPTSRMVTKRILDILVLERDTWIMVVESMLMKPIKLSIVSVT